MNRELVLVLDFGGQYNQLIARRVRECNVYCEVHPYNLSVEKIKEMNPKGIIFTGGPNSVYGENSPLCDKAIFELGIPILGICYGSQLMSYVLGGSVATAPVSEYGKTEVDVDVESKLFEGVAPSTICWMSHTDYIERAPEGFKIIGHTPVWNVQINIYMQFNSIQRLCILKRELRCYLTLFITFVIVLEIGKWIHLLKKQLKK